jgi:hypothetical protein
MGFRTLQNLTQSVNDRMGSNYAVWNLPFLPGTWSDAIDRVSSLRISLLRRQAETRRIGMARGVILITSWQKTAALAKVLL